jgi:uncharacterized protein
MKRVLRSIFLVGLLAYAGICAAMFAFQRSLIYFPAPRAVTAPESTLKLPVAGAELIVTVRALVGPKAVIYLGGNGEDVSQSLDFYRDVLPDHALYLLHYRGYGGSTGAPTEKDNVADALALYAKIAANHNQVSIIGRSLGTGVAVQVASQVKATRLVLITPYDSIVDIAAETYPWLPVRWLMLDTYESGKFADQIQIPTTIIAAENDDVIPYAHTEKLLHRFRPNIATMTVIKAVGHNNVTENQHFRDTVQAALR